MGLILADANIIIYIMNGLPAMKDFLDADFALSEISEIELLGIKGIDKKEQQFRQGMINECLLMNMNDPIKQTAIVVKQKYTVKVPDAIIVATAIYHRLPLLSGDKYFAKIKELDFIPLTL
jgi:predicted nucleic acid-binding protein